MQRHVLTSRTRACLRDDYRIVAQSTIVRIHLESTTEGIAHAEDIPDRKSQTESCRTSLSSRASTILPLC